MGGGLNPGCLQLKFESLSAYYHYLRFGEEVPEMILVGISYGSDTALHWLFSNQSRRTALPPGATPTAINARPYSMERLDGPSW